MPSETALSPRRHTAAVVMQQESTWDPSEVVSILLIVFLHLLDVDEFSLLSATRTFQEAGNGICMLQGRCTGSA